MGVKVDKENNCEFKTFISYAWSSKKHEEWIVDLAEKLVESGIDVILDKWELRLGHDMNYFMENAIKKSDKVLIICDKMYTEKSSKRSGGVGVETSIISSDVYNNVMQEKFIPIFVELDNDIYSVPAYLKGRMGIDLTRKNLDDKLEDIIRGITNQPKYRKPLLGQSSIEKYKNPINNLDKELYLRIKEMVYNSCYFVGEWDFASPSKSERINSLYEIEHYERLPEFIFMDKEMENLKSQLFKVIFNFTDLYAGGTFPKRDGLQEIPPEWRYNQEERYNRVRDELNRLGREIWKLFYDLFILGRQKYGV